MARQHVGDVYGRYSWRGGCGLFHFPILPLLLLGVHLISNTLRNVIVALQHTVPGDMLDQASEVRRPHRVMLLPVWINPTVRSLVASRAWTAHEGIHLWL